jgi:hypothetical protein
MKYPPLYGDCERTGERPPDFPAKCPTCGARMVNVRGIASDAYCDYSCGGGYRATKKQHALSGLHVWTGSCRAARNQASD